MIDILTDEEKVVMEMLIQGQQCRVITEWLSIDYISYNSIRKSILKKLAVNRTAQLLKIAIRNDCLF